MTLTPSSEDAPVTVIRTDDVMLDIETLGTRAGCVVLSAYAVGFNRNGSNNELQPSIKVTFSMTRQLLAGLRADNDTLQWYLEDKKGQLIELQESGACIERLEDGARRLNEFFSTVLQNNKEACIWGNDANFDIEIMLELYRHITPEPVMPFKYYKFMNVRTIKDTAEFTFGRQFFARKDSKRNHDPQYDCEYQIGMLQKYWGRINQLIDNEQMTRTPQVAT